MYFSEFVVCNWTLLMVGFFFFFLKMINFNLLFFLTIKMRCHKIKGLVTRCPNIKNPRFPAVTKPTPTRTLFG